MKTDTEIETIDNPEELKFPQECDNGGFVILDDLTDKEMKDPRVQVLFKRSRHNNLSIFINSQICYKLPKKTIRANGNVYQICKANNFRDVQNLYQDKASMDMTLDEYKYLTSVCWKKYYQLFTIDMTKDDYTGIY